MGTTGRQTRSLVVRHRRYWRHWWLCCRCGLWWRSCPDRGRSVLAHRVPPRPDIPPQLARADGLTPRPRPYNGNRSNRFGRNTPPLVNAEAAYPMGQRRRGARAETTGR
ncbi:hypothetical protein H4W31_005814 [Plantactinospora soyae]|uniref:Uncharacterized protein n=1 Tax=Plantactinospora soyae TaxID=1544732 RepID=A0A927MBN7_9ACTN|nr:hypothetical protein [Plantactinospora soyae]